MAQGQDAEGFYFGGISAYSDEGLHNARLLASMLMAKGWQPLGIAGFYSAVTHESSFDPRKIEGNRSEAFVRANPAGSPDARFTGTGLIQWTPGYNTLIKWCDDRGLDWKLASSQVAKLEAERTGAAPNEYYVSRRPEQGLYPKYAYYKAHFSQEPPLSMTEYVTAPLGKWTSLELAAAFVCFYTRPESWKDTAKWQRNAEDLDEWYRIITGSPLPPVPPTPGQPGFDTRKKSKFMFYMKRW